MEVDVTSATPGNLINTIPAWGGSPTYGGQGLSAQTIDPNSGTTVDIHNNPAPPQDGTSSATLNVVGVQSPTLSKSFNPNTIGVGGKSKLTITLHNTDILNPLTQTTFTDALPSGLTLANPVKDGSTPILSNCGESLTPPATLLNGPGGTAAAPGDFTLTLNNGTIPKNSDCVITVDVTSAKAGTYINVIPGGPASLYPGAI